MEVDGERGAELLAAVHAFFLPAPEDEREEARLEERAEAFLEEVRGEEETLVSFLSDRQRFVQASAGLTLATTQWLQLRNQFVVVSTDAKRALVKVMAEDLRQLMGALSHEALRKAEAFSQVCGAHLARIDRWMERWIGGMPEEVPCAEYSAALQLSLLGLDPATLVQPVLDVGSGRDAALLHALRGAGIEAYGVDPVGSSEWVIGRDWMGFAFEPDKWGTIVSHQGFSLHFLHHHFREGDEALRYGTKYMEILGSLKRGGSFFYVPSLPFIEDLLPKETYAVQRMPLPEPLQEGFSWVKELDPGLDVASATQITKR